MARKFWNPNMGTMLFEDYSAQFPGHYRDKTWIQILGVRIWFQRFGPTPKLTATDTHEMARMGP